VNNSTEFSIDSQFGSSREDYSSSGSTFIRGGSNNLDVVPESLYGFVHLADVRYTGSVLVLLRSAWFEKESRFITVTRMSSPLTVDKVIAEVAKAKRM
jgi:hypothetical protein